MNTLQIIYVITFDDSNYCFEQAILSMCSVRMHNSHVRIRIVTDKSSAQFIIGWRDKLLKEYGCEVSVCDVPEGLGKVERSRFLKTSLGLLVEGDFLFIDTDTIICRPLDEISESHGDVNAVLDRHVRLHENDYMIFPDDWFDQTGFISSHDDVYFNSGVMYVRDTAASKAFYQEWHRLWQLSLSRGMRLDQMAMYQANINSHHIIQEIDGRWNCQLGGLFLNYLHDAYIIHYYGSGNVKKRKIYKLKQTEVYQDIRSKQGISVEILEQLKHPYQQFNQNYLVLNGGTLDVYENSKACLDLCSESPRRFWLVNKLAQLIQKTYKK